MGINTWNDNWQLLPSTILVVYTFVITYSVICISFIIHNSFASDKLVASAHFGCLKLYNQVFISANLSVYRYLMNCLYIMLGVYILNSKCLYLYCQEWIILYF